MRRIIALSLAFGMTLVLAFASPAFAQTKRPTFTGNPVNDIQNAVEKQAATGATNAANDLTKVFQDVANFIGQDNTAAIALATEIPSIQDGNGQQCWISMQSFAAVFKAHPIPLTLKVASDLEALRLAQIAANQMCANPACTVVFSDLVNTVAQVSPINIVVPSLTQLCSKVPQIALTKPVTYTPPAATPAVVTPPVTPAQ
jgi:hypothetical protein